MPIITDGSSAQVSNLAFIENVKTEQGREKSASAMTDFVRSYIREVAFMRKIIPPKPVVPADLVPQLDSDQPMRIVEMDVASEAYFVTYQEDARSKYYTGKKFPVYYRTIESEKFEKSIEEIQTYRTPIKTLVQENYLKDIQIKEDAMAINSIDEILARREAATTAGDGAGTAIYKASGPITTSIIAEGLKRLVHKKVPIGTILISESDWLDFLKANQASVGSAVMEDIVVNGYSYTKLMGHTFIRTLKNEVVKPGHIYMFTTPDYLGVFDVMTDVKAFVKQEGPNISFYLWESIGITFGNVNGVAKIELT